jgi:putative transposase
VRTAGNRRERKTMIDTQHKLSIRKQAELLDVNRNRLEAKRHKISKEDHEVMLHLDEIHFKYCHMGQRNLILELLDRGYHVGRKRVRRLMNLLGIRAMVPQPYTSTRNKSHKIYPYLLRDHKVTHADEVWCTDITYIAMPKGHAYLIAIMDWHTRAVLSWEVSNTMDASFCKRALKRAFDLTGRQPEIFNTDQGSQFTSQEWVSELEERGIKVSMDGKGCWRDNVFIERLWRSIKYEKLRLWSYSTITELEGLVSDWMNFYNHKRHHQGLENQKPWELYSSYFEAVA